LFKKVCASGALVLFVCLLIGAGFGCGADTVAQVGKSKISQQDLDEVLRRQHGEEVLQQLIMVTAIRNEFQKRGMTLTEEELLEELGTDRATLEEQATQQGLDLDTVIKEQLEPQMMLRKMAQQRIEPTEDDLREFYDTYQDLFDEQPSYTYRSLWVSSEAKAKEALADVRGGTPFAEAVLAYSEDATSRATKGLQENVPANRVPAQLQALEEGEISDPLSFGQRWLVVQMLTKTEGAEKTYAEVQERVKEAYIAQSLPQEMQELLKEIAATANVDVLSPEYQSVKESFADLENQFLEEQQLGTAEPTAEPAAPAENEAEAE
jgi:foldase protein PrsA